MDEIYRANWVSFGRSSTANVVKDIVSMSFNQEDETSFFCYRALDMKLASVFESCLKFIVAKVDNESARLMSEAAETTQQMDEWKRLSFEKFWDKIKNESDQVDKAKLKERIDRKSLQKASPPRQHELGEMKQKRTKDEISKIFSTLPIWVIDELLKD